MPALDDVRRCGDATAEQRAELRRLLETKVYGLRWRQQLYTDIKNAGGLSKARALAALKFLRSQPNLGGAAPQATAEQTAKILLLLRRRIVARSLSETIRAAIADGTLTRDQADTHIYDLDRAPAWADTTTHARPLDQEGPPSS